MTPDKTPSDTELLALNAGEVHFSESPTKYPEAGHGTQYHAGAPGVLSFARAVLAKWGSPVVAGEPVAYRRPDKHGGFEYEDGITSFEHDPTAERLYTTPQPTQAQAGAVPLTPFIPVQRERLFYNRPENVGKGLVMADWHRVVQYVEAAHGIKGKEAGNAD